MGGKHVLDRLFTSYVSSLVASLTAYNNGPRFRDESQHRVHVWLLSEFVVLAATLHTWPRVTAVQHRGVACRLAHVHLHGQQSGRDTVRDTRHSAVSIVIIITRL